MAISRAVIQWDISMMVMIPIQEEVKAKLRAGARSMLQSSLGEMLIGPCPYNLHR